MWQMVTGKMFLVVIGITMANHSSSEDFAEWHNT